MKFCRLENYSCQENTPTSDLTALAWLLFLTCSLSYTASCLSHFTYFLSFISNTKYVWHELLKTGVGNISLTCSRKQSLNLLVCPFLQQNTGRNEAKSYHTQLFCFSIMERFYFLIALKFGWTIASKRHIHCWSVTAINISSPIPSSQERGINQLSVLLYLWVNEWKSHCSL